MNRLDISAAKQIGKTIGILSCHGQEAEMIIGDFLKVRVEVDVSKPLYRGKKVIMDDEEEVWVAFQYEKLPNFCYWCGMVYHNDKDCDIWLSSKGSLLLESQEFGAWMQATPFNLGRKTFCSVPRLEVFHEKKVIKRIGMMNVVNKLHHRHPPPLITIKVALRDQFSIWKPRFCWKRIL